MRARTSRTLLCAIAAVFALALSASADAATLTADYPFLGSRASTGTAPAATDVVTPPNVANHFATEAIDGVPHTVLVFPRKNGIEVGGAGLDPSGSYSIAVLFNLDDVSYFRKVIDF